MLTTSLWTLVFLTNRDDKKNRNNLDFNDIRLFIVKMNIIQNQVYKNFEFSRIQEFKPSKIV